MHRDAKSKNLINGNSHINSIESRVTWQRKDITIDIFIFIFMLWPLLINGGPFYSADSSSYLRGGTFGFNAGLLFLSQWWDTIFAAPHLEPASFSIGGDGPAANGAHSIVQNAVAKSGGVRSVAYSAVAYILRFPGSSLFTLALFQAGAVTLLVSYFRRLIVPHAGLWAGIAAGAGIAILTTAPWYSAYAMPDIFAGLTVGGALILTLFFDRLSVYARILAIFLVAFGAITHDSHLPIAFCTLAAGAAMHFWLRRISLVKMATQTIWFVSPLVIATVILFATSLIVFSETSLSPKHYPIPLARSVSDGPGYWYLRKHCATEKYAICEVFGSNPPREVGPFLWGPDGVRHKASAEQMDRIRTEEPIIIRRATLEYPLTQIGASARNAFTQFFKFGLTGLKFGQTIIGKDNPVLTQNGSDLPMLRFIFEIIVYTCFIICLALLFYFWRAITRIEFAAVAVALTGLLANAAVCGMLSAVTDRYQGRVAWILPSLVMFIILRILIERRSGNVR